MIWRYGGAIMGERSKCFTLEYTRTYIKKNLLNLVLNKPKRNAGNAVTCVDASSGRKDYGLLF